MAHGRQGSKETLSLDLLDVEEVQILREASKWEDENPPHFLDALEILQHKLLDTLSEPIQSPSRPILNQDLVHLMQNILRSL